MTLDPASAAVRYRHVVKGERHFYLLFNEEAEAVTATVKLAVKGKRLWLDPSTGTAADAEQTVTWSPHETESAVYYRRQRQ